MDSQFVFSQIHKGLNNNSRGKKPNKTFLKEKGISSWNNMDVETSTEKQEGRKKKKKSIIEKRT